MKKLEDYALEELLEFHPDDISVQTHGFTTGAWEWRISALRAAGTPCDGCKHVVFRFPYPSMFTCTSCSRAYTDQHEKDKGRGNRLTGERER